MKKLITLLLLFIAPQLFAQWTGYGLGLIQRPNARTAQIYLMLTNVVAGSNVVFTLLPDGRYRVDSTGGTNTIILTNITYVTNVSFVTNNITVTNTGLASITNDGHSGISLIVSSNAPIAGLKSLTAGSGITLTNQDTNIVIAATPAFAAPDIMALQTNRYVTYRYVNLDTAAGGTPSFNGWGDTLANAAGTAEFEVDVNNGWWNTRSAATSGTSARVNLLNRRPLFSTNGTALYFQAYVSFRNTNDVRIYVGLYGLAANTFVANDLNAAEQMVFRYSTGAGDTTWKVITGDGSSTTVTDTGVAVAADTDYLFQITKNDAAPSATFTINRASSTTVATTVPDNFTLLGPLVSTTTLANAAKTNRVRYVGYQMDYLPK